MELNTVGTDACTMHVTVRPYTAYPPTHFTRIKALPMRECRNCNTKFKPTRNWQVFCKTICRDIYNNRQRRECFYCGAPSYHRDHIDPVSRTNKKRDFAKDEWVFSCVECNLTLRDKIFDSIEDRMSFLLQHYKNKVAKFPEWDEKEVEEMGPSLRVSIDKHIMLKHQYEVAVRYLTLRTGWMLRHHAGKTKFTAEETTAHDDQCLHCKKPIRLKENEAQFCSSFCKWMHSKT